MVTHIVMWKLKDEAAGRTKEENARLIKQKLKALIGAVDTIEHLEVGLNFNSSEAAYDVALYSVFKNRAGLTTYQNHPEHLDAAHFLRSVVQARVVADYEH
ncbi:stress responsive protein [candidate division KSB3 bacterium]|uniref:Stress responsive protein n=1 Tax=candidate division KSB3 bacterium TaxID=2044937 RepID=A0A2G6E2B6_9BACT|nr:MAG: stress responsive protein [candidate division KSB3 bacterium]PIE28825.1 MAG: stress responsive protein [candidate division KSB3 bacterium]